MTPQEIVHIWGTRHATPDSCGPSCHFGYLESCDMISNVMKPLVIAHRGASADAPENTLAAFNLAWEQGADGIECDIWSTSDGYLVCSHDRNMSRTAGVEQDIPSSRLSEINALDVGSWKGDQWQGERVPQLKNVLATIPTGKQIFIEIKDAPIVLPSVFSTVECAGIVDEQVTIISFRRDVILESKQARPTIDVLLLIEVEHGAGTLMHADAVVAECNRIGADGVGIEAVDGVDEVFVATISDAGLSLNAWTVDDVEKAKRLFDFGVSSITTNRPAALIAVRQPGSS